MAQCLGERHPHLETCADARRMLSFDSDTARTIDHGRRRTHLRYTRPSSNHALLHYALVALAVVAALLLSTGAQANLVEEVPLTHWSYDALERLASAGFVDRLSHQFASAYASGHALTRFQLASAARETLALAATLMTGADAEGIEPRRELSALLTFLDLRLQDAVDLHRRLSHRIREAEGSAGDESVAEMSTAALAIRDGLDRFSQEMSEIREAVEAIKESAPPLVGGAVGPLDRVSDPAAMDLLISRTRKAIDQLDDAIVRLDGSINHLLLRLAEHEVTEMGRSVSLLESVTAYMRVFGENSRLNKREASASELSPFELVDDLRSLASEYAADIERLGGLGAQGVDIRELILEEGDRRPTEDEDRFSLRADRGVSLDAIIASIERSRGDEGDGGENLSSNGSRRVVAYLLAPTEPGPSTNRGQVEKGASAARLTDQSAPKAEYGFRLFGLRMKTSLSMDTWGVGETFVPATRLEASLPFPGDRGEIEAGYSFVDVDRLREIASYSRNPDPRRYVDRRLLDQDERPRFHVAGEVPLGGAVSIRVGYELRPAGERSPNSESVLGAGLEYRLGERGNLTADLRWRAEPEIGQAGAGVGFGYRLGENTSLAASYSMISFESAKDALASGVGEAELVVRF